MGEFDESFNDEIFQQIHQEILQERDGQWMVGEGEKPEEGGVEMMDYLFFIFYLKIIKHEKTKVSGWLGRVKSQRRERSR